MSVTDSSMMSFSSGSKTADRSVAFGTMWITPSPDILILHPIAATSFCAIVRFVSLFSAITAFVSVGAFSAYSTGAAPTLSSSAAIAAPFAPAGAYQPFAMCTSSAGFNTEYSSAVCDSRDPSQSVAGTWSRPVNSGSLAPSLVVVAFRYIRTQTSPSVGSSVMSMSADSINPSSNFMMEPPVMS